MRKPKPVRLRVVKFTKDGKMKLAFNQDLILPPFMTKDSKKRMLLDKDQVDMNTIIEIKFSL